MTQEPDWIVRHEIGGWGLVHPAPPRELSCSPDGRWLGCVYAKDSGVVWEREGLRKHRELTGGKQLVFSQDSQALFWLQENRIDVISLESGESLRKIGPVEHLEHFALSPSGERMALAAGGVVLIGEWQTGKLLQRLPVSGESVWAAHVAFVDEERVLCAEAVKESGLVQFVLWELATGKALWTAHETADAAREFVLSADRELFASRIATHNTVRIWQTRDGATVQDISVAGEWALAWAFSPDGTQLIVAEGANLEVHNILAGEREQTLAVGNSVHSLALAPSGDQLLVGCESGRVALWSLPEWEDVSPKEPGGHQSGLVQLLPLDDECVLCRSTDPERRLLSLELGQELVWSEERAGLESLVCDAKTLRVVGVRRSNPEVVVENGVDRVTVQTWEATGVLVQTREYALELPEQIWQPVLSLSPDGQWLAGGGNDQTVRVWSLETGEKVTEVCLFSVEESQVLSPFDDDNEIFAIDWWPGTPLLAVRRMSDMRMALVDAETGKRFLTGAELGDSPVFVAFLPGTTQLACAGSEYAALALFDLAEGTSTPLASPGVATALAALPDGRQIALGLRDKVCVYDIERQVPVAELAFPFGTVTALTATASGTQLVAGGEHGQLVVWERR